MRPLYLSFLLAFGLPACAGGGGDAGPGSLSAEPQTMVVQYDRDDDGEPDWVTLDTSKQPFQIVEAIHGTTNGEPLDMTDRQNTTKEPWIVDLNVKRSVTVDFDSNHRCQAANRAFGSFRLAGDGTMPKKPPQTPCYRLHQPTGQAVVRLNGRDCYLGLRPTWRRPWPSVDVFSVTRISIP